MKIKTKVDLEDEVYIMSNGKILKVPVIRIYITIDKPQHLRPVWNTLDHTITYAYDLSNNGVTITRPEDEVYLTRGAIIDALVPA